MQTGKKKGAGITDELIVAWQERKIEIHVDREADDHSNDRPCQEAKGRLEKKETL